MLTVSADRAVPVVAAVAEGSACRGSARDGARDDAQGGDAARLADAGVPQPRFAAVRTLHEARAAAETVGFPAVLKPADSGGQRGIFLLDSVDDLDAHLHAALAGADAGEAILESFHQGLEVNTLARRPGGACR